MARWPGSRATAPFARGRATSARSSTPCTSPPRAAARGSAEELLDRARREGRHVVVAGVDADNRASLRLHEQLGFEQVGRMPQVARKFDRWVDLSLLQITLS
jgi:L-amino acid N-acyltransferase YncA